MAAIACQMPVDTVIGEARAQAAQPAEARPRARDIGVAPGVLRPGALNAITDVDGVRVGHVTLVEGSNIRTGVTVILPHGGNLFQLWLASSGTSVGTANVSATALRFFFKVTLKRHDLAEELISTREPRRLPVVLSPEEVGRLLAAATNTKHRAILSVAYATGLRASEVVSLKLTDIDRDRMLIRVEQGKGKKDRYVIHSPILLEILHQWWRLARKKGWMSVDGPGRETLAAKRLRKLARLA